MTQEECIAALNAVNHSSNPVHLHDRMRIPVDAHLVWCGGGVAARDQLMRRFFDQAADTALVSHMLKQFERWLGL
jgi:hypothetical protein